jgi:peptidoglycan/xylan/chitin deacetylase (PgdA/CDA1 family)
MCHDSPTMASALPPLALAYHGIADVPVSRDPTGLFVRPRDFRRQVERLRSWGYRFVPFSELASRAPSGGGAGCAALTFDDGFADNLLTLVPLLQETEATATVFVVSGWLGGLHPETPHGRILTEDELRSLHGAGVEIGAHTATHPDLTTLDRDRVTTEFRRCRERLEAVIGALVAVAAYPYGQANDETIEGCREAGIVAACRTAGNGSWAEPLNLPRQDMDNGCTMTGLRLKRDDHYEPLMRYLPGRAARRLVREARRLRR